MGPRRLLVLFSTFFCLGLTLGNNDGKKSERSKVNADHPPSADLDLAGKVYKLPSGGSSLQSLKKIKEMMNVRKQNTKDNAHPRVSLSGHGVGSGFPFTSYGIGASNSYNFGPMRNRPHVRQPSIATGGYGPGGGPSTGGGPSYGPVGGGGSYGPGDIGGPSYGGGVSSGGGYGSSGGSGYSAPNLSVTDYRHIWVHMLQEIYKIIKDKSLLKDSSFGRKILDHLFYLLQKIRILHSHQSDEISCPEIYHRSGNLCLCVDFIDSFLDHYEARLYCQMVKGGDLVMFRDANEYHDIIKFINTIDVKNDHSYWLGLSDANKEGDWRFIDGRNIHFKSPFWGVREKTGRRKRSGTSVPIAEIAPFGQGDYAFFNKEDYYYIWDGDDKIAESKMVLPLCQYIPERDQQNFQYGEGIWESWNEYNEWAGWNDKSNVHKEPPHSHGYGHGPFSYGMGPFMGGNHGPWKRSNTQREPRLEDEDTPIKDLSPQTDSQTNDS